MRRRAFLLGGCSSVLASPGSLSRETVSQAATLFLSGDVMTGRGIDQLFATANEPTLYEPFVTSARRYVQLGESISGPVRKPAAYSYIWGDALDELERIGPDFRVINLETSVTTSDTHWPGKGIHYRMHPDNIPCITAASIDCCVLANNHVLDWGYPGLRETLHTLRTAGLETAGAGRDIEEARAPAVLELGGGCRVLLFGFASRTSGVPNSWAASKDNPGVHLLEDVSADRANEVATLIGRQKNKRDLVVASIHWGANWGYRVPTEHREFARGLIDQGVVDVVHGHSSHHPQGIEVYKGKAILYGCGDLINDYEGIGGYERYRPELSLLYFVRIDVSTGRLDTLRMVPMRMRRFRLNRVTDEEALWLERVLSREGRPFGTWVEWSADRVLELRWHEVPDELKSE